ncbi:MAG: hypothetical protein JOZ69_19455 [Myxococcales bacterium]|nr:hypothetical protein [Myxococcales bacterium]
MKRFARVAFWLLPVSATDASIGCPDTVPEIVNVAVTACALEAPVSSST